jgi:hypothetical protein
VLNTGNTVLWDTAKTYLKARALRWPRPQAGRAQASHLTQRNGTDRTGSGCVRPITAVQSTTMTIHLEDDLKESGRPRRRHSAQQVLSRR